MEEDLVHVWVTIRPGLTRLKKLPKDEEGVKHIKFKCKLCKEKNDYYTKGDNSFEGCMACKGTGESRWKPGRTQTAHVKKIPGWRLDMDDASPEEILQRSSGDFGKMPSMSAPEWEKFYSQPHEQKRQQEFQQKQRQEREQILRSLG